MPRAGNQPGTHLGRMQSPHTEAFSRLSRESVIRQQMCRLSFRGNSTLFPSSLPSKRNSHLKMHLCISRPKKKPDYMQIQNLCVQRRSGTQQVEGSGPRGCTSHPRHPVHSLEDFRVWLTVIAPTPSTDLHTHTADAPLPCPHGGCPPLSLPPRHPSNLHSFQPPLP